MSELDVGLSVPHWVLTFFAIGKRGRIASTGRLFEPPQGCISVSGCVYLQLIVLLHIFKIPFEKKCAIVRERVNIFF